MVRKRFLGASIALHLLVFAVAIAGTTWRLRGQVRPAPAPSADLVRLVDLPRPAPAPPVREVSPIAYPRPVPRPTIRPTPRPQAVRPTASPTPRPREVAEYRRLNPALRKVDDERARMMVARLKQLGLSAASASAVTREVDRAIAEGSQRVYRPTTPDGSESLQAAGVPATESMLPQASDSPFVPPVTWVSTPSPLDEFLGRILPADQGFDADLTTDPATGLPELRLSVRQEVNYLTGRPLTFIERWNPGGPATPVVDVTVLTPTGEPERRFAMPLPPFGGSLEDFKRQMFGLTMLAYQEALAGRSLATP